MIAIDGRSHRISRMSRIFRMSRMSRDIRDVQDVQDVQDIQDVQNIQVGVSIHARRSPTKKKQKNMRQQPARSDQERSHRSCQCWCKGLPPLPDIQLSPISDLSPSASPTFIPRDNGAPAAIRSNPPRTNKGQQRPINIILLSSTLRKAIYKYSSKKRAEMSPKDNLECQFRRSKYANRTNEEVNELVKQGEGVSRLLHLVSVPASVWPSAGHGFLVTLRLE